MDAYLEEKMEGADADSEGLTNDVYFSQDDTVIKVYSKYPLTSFYVAAIDILAFKFRYLDRSQRISNEIEVKKEIKAAGLNAPKIIHRADNALEFEKVEGISGYRYLERCNDEEAYKFGRKVGEFLPRLHDRNVALKDFRISNMMIGDDIALIDHEYSDLNANRVLKWFDYLTLVSSVRQASNYADFKKGFGTEANMPRTALAASIFTALGHSMLLERSPKRLKKTIYSIRTDFER